MYNVKTKPEPHNGSKSISNTKLIECKTRIWIFLKYAFKSLLNDCHKIEVQLVECIHSQQYPLNLYLKNNE